MMKRPLLLILVLFFIQFSCLMSQKGKGRRGKGGRRLRQKLVYNIKPKKNYLYQKQKLQKDIRNQGFSKKFVVLGDLVIEKEVFEVKFNNKPESRAYTGDRKWDQNIKDGRIQIQIGLSDFGNYHDYTQNLLDSVIKDYYEKTAIEFIQCDPWSSMEGLPRCGTDGFQAWIVLSPNPSNGLSGCSSYVGRWGDTNWRGTGMQQISLGSGCLYKHTMIHEILHALGWTHEQNRPDRDDYVEILWDNIDRRMWNNFETEKKGKVFGTDYDPMSVMQYSSSAFSKNGRPTIRSKDPKRPIPSEEVYWSEEHINKGMTDDDAFEINNVYTLAQWCKDNTNAEWAYGNDERCDGTGNCIKKGVKVPRGTTCKRNPRSDFTTDGPTISIEPSTPDDATTTSTTRRTTTRRPAKDDKWTDIFEFIFGIITAIFEK